MVLPIKNSNYFPNSSINVVCVCDGWRGIILPCLLNLEVISVLIYTQSSFYQLYIPEILEYYKRYVPLWNFVRMMFQNFGKQL